MHPVGASGNPMEVGFETIVGVGLIGIGSGVSRLGDLLKKKKATKRLNNIPKSATTGMALI